MCSLSLFHFFLFSWIKTRLNINPIFAGGLWPKWRIKLCITEPLTACAGAVTGPWEIHRDCLQHMSYIIASICTPTTTCELQMCTSPVISVETEEGGKKGEGMRRRGVCELKNQIALHCLFLSRLHCLNLGEKGKRCDLETYPCF